MKEKLFTIMLLLVAFMTNANAQSVVYSFDFNEIAENSGKQSIGFSKLKIYDNGTAHFEGYSLGGTKFDSTISIEKIENSLNDSEGSIVLYSVKGNNYKKQPFILIGGLLLSGNIGEIKGGMCYLYIGENEVYALSNFDFETNRENNEKQRVRMINDYFNRKGIFSLFDTNGNRTTGGSQNTPSPITPNAQPNVQ